MSVHKHTSGGRTRNVINIADPGGTTAAYSEKTAAITAPTSTSDGFKNFHSQKNLHIVVDNNDLNDGGAAMSVTVTVYGYNSSLGGVWAPLTIPIAVGNSNTLEYKSVVTPPVANNAPFRAVIPIEGVERIAVATTFSAGTRDGGNYSIWLGVNSI